MPDKKPWRPYTVTWERLLIGGVAVNEKPNRGLCIGVCEAQCDAVSEAHAQTIVTARLRKYYKHKAIYLVSRDAFPDDTAEEKLRRSLLRAKRARSHEQAPSAQQTELFPRGA